MQVIIWDTEKGNSLRANGPQHPTCESSVVCKMVSCAKLAAALSPCGRAFSHHFLQPLHGHMADAHMLTSQRKAGKVTSF